MSEANINSRAMASVVLAYGFRIFFLVLPPYLVISIVLWSGMWAGLIPPLFDDMLSWHIFELLFGAGSAGIAGFLLTALPEFFEQQKPLTGTKLLMLFLLWLSGRVAFWFGMLAFAGALNAAFLLSLLAVAAWPILTDSQRRHTGLLMALALIAGVQLAFFAAALGLLPLAPLAVLKSGIGAFMILELLAIRRIATGAVNEWLQHRGFDDEVFMARPPAYNLAVFCVLIYTTVELLWPGSMTLGWLGLAAATAIFNTLNDFLGLEHSPLRNGYIAALASVLLLMGLGYGSMGVDHLLDSFYALNHFRHLLTTGVIGLSLFIVMVIVATIHTGREFNTRPWIVFAVALLLLATGARVAVAFYPVFASTLYAVSALLWAAAFIIYSWQFADVLRSPRVDGLPG